MERKGTFQVGLRTTTEKVVGISLFCWPTIERFWVATKIL